MNPHIAFKDAFASLKKPYTESIALWVYERGVSEKEIGRFLSSLANDLIANGCYPEAYWCLMTFKQGLMLETNHVVDKVVDLTVSKCMERALQWMDNDFKCPETVKCIFEKNIQNNIRALLGAAPALCASLLNAPKDNRLAINYILEPGVKSQPMLSIQYQDRDGKPWASIAPHKRLVFSDVQNGICFWGMGNGAQVIRFYKETTLQYPELSVGLYIIEHSYSVFRANLAMHDWSEIIDSGRIFFFIGRDGTWDFISYLKKEDQFLPSYDHINDPVIAQVGVVEKKNVIASKMARAEENKNHVLLYYQDKDDWNDIFSQNRKKRKIRVLGLTSRFTVYIQYCMRDWLAGFKNIGCDVALLIEKDHTLRLTNDYAMTVIKDFKPDIILGVCYNRKDLSFELPSNIPYINWQQDKLPHNSSFDAAEAIGGSDFIITTHYARQWLLEYGYPEEKFWCLSYFPTNTNLYAPVSVTGQDMDTYGCDISFVSNCSDTAAQAFSRLREKYRSADRKLMTLLDDYFEIIRATFTQWKDYPVNRNDYEMIFDGLCGEFEITREMREEITFQFLFIGDRLLRQKPLEALAQSGVNLFLYGANWEAHPRLGRYARGVARNGEELKIIFNASKIVYHAISPTTFHPRFMDAAACRSFIIVKKLRVDSDSIETFFEPGKDFIYFEGPDDIVSTVSYYLENKDMREKISESIYRNVQKCSYNELARSILEKIARDPYNITV